jgi:peptidyl-prolyl cis-trans isomerase SurA
MRKVLKVLVIWLVALATPALAANPYAPALTVNEGVITNYDIAQRMKLLDALGANGDLHKLAVQQLTEDRVKVQAARELQIELPEGAIDAGLDEFATSRGLKTEDVLRVLNARGIDRQTMDDFVESGLLWREVVGAKFRARATPSEADLDAALEMAATTPREMLTLAEIALPYAERGEAETDALAEQIYRQISRGASFADMAREYSRSATAEHGGLLEPVPAARLPDAFRSQVLLLSPGQVTRPLPISGGVALVKLVSIAEVRPDPKAAPAADDPDAREALRAQLFNERITSFGQGYLQELLGDALIVER